MIYQSPFFWGALITLGLVIGYFIRQLIAVRQLNSIEQRIKRQIEEAKSKAKEIILEAQEKATTLLEEVKKEERESKIQLGRLEERLLKKEEQMEGQSLDLKRREDQIIQDVEKLKTAKLEIDELKQKAVSELERITGLSAAQAKNFLLKSLQEKYQQELASTVQKLDKERREEIERRSLEIMTTAIQRYARSHVGEITTTAFSLND
ncbi:hypothetical protein COY97_00850, partial [Candidatus Wolfebacteria bacterium CG_4_10_14_0_8_um_filter_39_64]